MIVFKNYFKILKSYLPVVIMYIAIFTFFVVMINTTTNQNSMYEKVKPVMAIINNDEETPLIKGFKNYIKQNADIKNIENDKEKISDALFFREVDFVLIIPKNYTSNFLALKNPKIETLKVPDSKGAMYSEMILNKYLNSANIYASLGMDEKKIVSNIKKDLKTKAKITFLNEESSNLEKANTFYNFMNYTILATVILIVGMLSNTFNDLKLKRRNLVSKYSYRKINRELFLGHAVVILGLWLLYFVIAFILFGSVIFSLNGLLLNLNSLIFCLTALSLGFLVGNLVSSKQAQSGIVNVISLGSSFICGAFVPQEMLGAGVLSLAKVFPSYYFITNNNLITKLSNYKFDSIIPLIINMSIMIIFAILFFVITNVVTRMKLKKQ